MKSKQRHIVITYHLSNTVDVRYTVSEENKAKWTKENRLNLMGSSLLINLLIWRSKSMRTMVNGEEYFIEFKYIKGQNLT